MPQVPSVSVKNSTDRMKKVLEMLKNPAAAAARSLPPGPLPPPSPSPPRATTSWSASTSSHSAGPDTDREGDWARPSWRGTYSPATATHKAATAGLRASAPAAVRLQGTAGGLLRRVVGAGSVAAGSEGGGGGGGGVVSDGGREAHLQQVLRRRRLAWSTSGQPLLDGAGRGGGGDRWQRWGWILDVGV